MGRAVRISVFEGVSDPNVAGDVYGHLPVVEPRGRQTPLERTPTRRQDLGRDLGSLSLTHDWAEQLPPDADPNTRSVHTFTGPEDEFRVISA